LAGVVLSWGPGAEPTLGALLVAAACVAWGIDNGVTARIDQLAPEHVVFLKGAVAGSVNLVLGLALASGATGLDARSLLWALAVGAAGYGLSITLWVKGARELGAARGQLIFASAPFIGAVTAWVVLADPVGAGQVLAIV